MASLLFTVLLLAMTGYSGGSWCVCKEGMSDVALQKTLDYACGSGADCNPIHQNGLCFNPNTVRAHCNYAVNSYFQRNRQISTACDFSGTATIVTSDPSSGGCVYPASVTASNTPNGGTTVPNSNSPLVTAAPNSIPGGGVGNNGLGPSGVNDVSDGRARFTTTILCVFSAIAPLWVLVFW